MTEQRTLNVLRVLGDMAISVAIFFAAFWLRMNVSLPFTDKLLPEANFSRLIHFWWVVAVAQSAALYFSGAYDADNPEDGPVKGRATSAAGMLSTLGLIAFYFFLDIKFPRTFFLLYLAVVIPALLGWQWIISKLRVPAKRRRALLVGVNETSAALLREIQRRPWLGLDVVGLVHEEAEPVLAGNTSGNTLTIEGTGILGYRSDLPRIVTEHAIDHVILTPNPGWQDRLIDELGQMQGRRARITLVPSPFEIMIGKPQQRRVHDIPLIDFMHEPMGNASRFIKRSMDLAGALLLTLLVLPVLLLTALAIRFISPGPIFYRQERVGRLGRPFSIIKFRTMVMNAEQLTGAVFAQKNDPRIFPLGKFLRKTRIDELPQIWNILNGDMSFVGPRPERPHFVDQFRKEIPGYAERLRVKPGVTGLAQVNGFYETSAENKIKFDLTYIYNYSVLMDVKILLETVKVVLTGRGT
jgi:exopolysaccharide biosynthesis polyprenyl glycosylphosphotransferase